MRGSGLVALVLLSVTVALGVVGVRRWRSGRWPRLLTAGLHRNLALLSVSFLAVHIVTAVIDSWVGLSWIGIVVPFTSTYRPAWVGLGIVAFDLVVAVIATSLLRRHLRYRAWRSVHWCTWMLWPLALLHAMGSGTDAASAVGLVVCGCSAGIVGAAALWRLWPRVPRLGRGSALGDRSASLPVRAPASIAKGRRSGVATTAGPVPSAQRG
jgi:predicted ferric reductase